MDWTIAVLLIVLVIVGNTLLEHHLRKKRLRIEDELESLRIEKAHRMARATAQLKEDVNRRLQEHHKDMQLMVLERAREIRDDGHLPGDEWKGA